MSKSSKVVQKKNKLSVTASTEKVVSLAFVSLQPSKNNLTKQNCVCVANQRVVLVVFSSLVLSTSVQANGLLENWPFLCVDSILSVVWQQNSNRQTNRNVVLTLCAHESMTSMTSQSVLAIINKKKMKKSELTAQEKERMVIKQKHLFCLVYIIWCSCDFEHVESQLIINEH